MICSEEIRLATFDDARCIAEMSKNLVESGLGWSWTSSRVAREIKAKNVNVIVAVKESIILGFAVMRYFDDEARLNLFAVHPKHRRKGIGGQMIQWLEEATLINGIGIVYLETRLSNEAARKFYESQGYEVVQRIPGYYRGREAAVRMAHDLWSDASRK